MQISPIQQTQNTNFKAKLQLSGNASLLKNEQTQALRTIVDKLGLKTDIVDINLSYKLINNGFINLAIFANNKLSQFLGEFKNNDIYSGVINALEQTKEINMIEKKQNPEKVISPYTKIEKEKDYKYILLYASGIILFIILIVLIVVFVANKRWMKWMFQIK